MYGAPGVDHESPAIMEDMTGIAVFAHGSSVAEANDSAGSANEGGAPRGGRADAIRADGNATAGGLASAATDAWRRSI